MSDIYICTGEASGDLYGFHLAQMLKQLRPSLTLSGVAGERLRSLGLSGSVKMEELQVMGFTDVVLALPRLVKLFRKIRHEILQLQPRAVICIDYPGFHLRLEESLRRHGYSGKLIHAISPTVWAWGKRRIPKMARTLDLLLTLFPFEKECFAQTPLHVEHVGHPLASRIPSPLRSQRQKLLALFPGSRETEVARNLPLQLQTARHLQQLDPQLEIAVSLAHPALAAQIPPGITLIGPEQNYDLMRRCRLALAKSGTVTLELALHETPTIVQYAIKPIDVFLAQKIFRIDLPHYCIVNIICKKRVFPELFGPHLTQQALDAAAEKYWFDESARAECIEGCKEMRTLLGPHEAEKRAAEMILNEIKF